MRGTATLATEKLFSSSDEFYRNPYAFQKRLREIAPILWNPFLKVWFVTGYQEAEAIYKSPLAGWGEPPYRGKRLPEQLHYFERMQAKSLIFLDRPNHTRLKRLLQQPLVDFAWETLIQKNTREILNNNDRQVTIDIVRDFGYPLTTAVIMDVVGIPESDRETVRPIMADQLSTFEIDRSDAVREKGDRSMEWLVSYFTELVAQRHRSPGDDLISSLIAAQYEEDKLDNDEVIINAIMILVGGYDNVNSLLANSVLALLSQPALLEQLRGNPNLLTGVINEVLRFDPPVQLSYRRALQPLNIGDVNIAQGDGMIIFIAAANRDPRRFDKPDTFVVERGERGLAFGLGIHTCLGAQLALDQIRIAVEQLLKRFPDISLALEQDSLKYDHSLMFRRLRSLPVTV